MVVLITNVTDGPGKKPKDVRVYNKKIRPGAELRVNAKYVDDKVRKLEDAGYIVIGPVPSWYADYAAKRQTKNLSSEQVREKLEAQQARTKAKAAKKEAPKPAPAPKPTPAPVAVTLSDSVEPPTDEVTTEKKGSKKSKKRR